MNKPIALALSIFSLLATQARAGQQIVETARGVVAEVNGKAITAGELEEAVAGLSTEARALIDNPEGRRRFVEGYITEKILVAEARRRKIDRSPKYARWVDQAKTDVLLALLREQILRDVRLDEQELKDFYAAHQKDFSVPEMRRVRHILAADEKRARAILKQIRAGKSFEDEARRHSQDGPSAAEGGDLGWNTREDWVPEFAKAVFAMKAGELMDRPLKTRFGWHVIRLEAVKPEAVPPFDEIRQTVLRRAMAERGERTLPEFFKQLKEKSDIKIHDAGLDAFRIFATPK